MTGIKLSGVGLDFGPTRALDSIDLSVPQGAFLALLGPSGCGKTTLLRLLAGLERPTRGRIEINGRLMAEANHFLPPEERNLGMVFQSYALWPHMSVAGNIRFGLRLKKLPRAEEEGRISDALEMVGLAGMGHRRPHELSGGQRQRVALARSLAMRPSLILLDEPLANLDAHLRGKMLEEFRRIHSATQTGFVFVTHDQDEAMAVATHVGVMSAGKLEQLAAPQELYSKPKTEMVARFVGVGSTVPVTVLAYDGRVCTIRLQDQILQVEGEAPLGAAWLCLRAQDIRPAQDGVLRATITDSRFKAGIYAANAEIDAGAALSLTLPYAPQQGEVIRFNLNGGWVLPRLAEHRAA